MSLRQSIGRLRSHGQVIPPGDVSVRFLHGQFLPVQRGSVRSLLNRISAPSRLQFRLQYFYEHESTDSGLQGASDEVYVSAIGTDSAAVRVGPDHKPAVDLLRAAPIGDVSDDNVRDPWRNNPHVLLEFDLLRPGDWPRTYTSTLLLVEEDNADLQDSFNKLYAEVGDEVKGAVVATAYVAGAAVGAAIGSAIPGLGTAVGAAVGALSAAAFDEIVDAISSGFGNEVFTPRSVTLTVADPAQLGQHPDVDHERTEHFEEHGAKYDLLYDWHVLD